MWKLEKSEWESKNLWKLEYKLLSFLDEHKMQLRYMNTFKRAIEHDFSKNETMKLCFAIKCILCLLPLAAEQELIPFNDTLWYFVSMKCFWTKLCNQHCELSRWKCFETLSRTRMVVTLLTAQRLKFFTVIKNKENSECQKIQNRKHFCLFHQT